MSNKNNKDEVSLGIIIFLLFAFPPAGVILLISKYGIPIINVIFSYVGDIFTRKNRYSGYEKKDGEKIFTEFWNSDAAKNSDEAKTEPEEEPTADKPGKLPYRVSSTILLILGGFFLFVGFWGALTEFIEFGLPYFRTEDFGAFLTCLGLGGFLGGIGVVLRSKLKLAKKYISVIGLRGRITIEELSKSLNQSRSKTKKELQKVIDSGIFGEYAYLDMGRQMFLRNSSFIPTDDKVNKDTPDMDAELDEYARTLKKIRRLNDDIKDIPVSNRIDLIEEYTKKIFEYQKKNPDREKDVHTFMTYYLPTTLKLLESYSEIERVGVAGENMKSAKESIEKTLDLLVEAYKRLLDQLYESDNLDISSDIDVLEKMMQKDGLSGGGFGKTK